VQGAVVVYNIVSRRREKHKEMTILATEVKIAVIGGSGLYEIEGFDVNDRVAVKTPFGSPSDEIVIGELEGVPAAFLPRHGVGHRIHPGALPVRANIWALKTLGVEKMVSVSAVGSLKEEIKPRDFVIPDQFFDHTKSRQSTFFDEGPVVHISLADPYCEEMRRVLVDGCKAIGVGYHDGGTYINMEGPQFSTRAESRVYRQWGMDVIGMTSATEVKLAREAEMCLGTVALSTDYDVWYEEDVTIEMVLANVDANITHVKALIRAVLPAVAELGDCACNHALENAIITDRSMIPPDVIKRLKPIIGKYLR
jgi:5'-methylthioadenosine phosphorylase